MKENMTYGELCLQVLGVTLHELFKQDEVSRLLNLTEPKDEEFWKTQRNIVTNRFLSYLLFQSSMPLTLQRAEMTLRESSNLQLRARAYLDEGLTYEKVRCWWLTKGKFLHSRAFAAKHERELLESSCLRVLCFFENTRPLWLNYNAEGTPTLHESREAAFEFSVSSPTELLPETCRRMADEFKALSRLIGATSVKVLPGQKRAPNPSRTIRKAGRDEGLEGQPLGRAEELS